jgi:hypothetical protein
MPVILTTDEKRDMWMRGFGRGGHSYRPPIAFICEKKQVRLGLVLLGEG